MKKVIIIITLLVLISTAFATSYAPNEDLYIICNGKETIVTDIGGFADFTSDGGIVLASYLIANQDVIEVCSYWDGQDFVVDEVYFNEKGKLCVEEHERISIIYVDWN